ncbi:MAG: alpha/beta hydrolase [Pseudomonadales bacterium]
MNAIDLAPTRKGYVDGPYGQIHYREAGSGAPLVLLHQTSQSSVQYEHALPLLAAAGFRVIALDTPGYGMSDLPLAPPSVDEYAAAIAVAISALCHEPAALVGHHTGAAVAGAVAANHPEQVRHLILHSPPVYTAQERSERQARPRLDQSPREDGSHFMARWKVSHGKTGNTASLAATHMSTLCAMIAGDSEWYGHQASFSYDLGDALTRVICPTTILSNTGDIIHHLAERASRIKPTFQYTEIEGGTSQIIWDEAERWSQAIIALINNPPAKPAA